MPESPAAPPWSRAELERHPATPLKDRGDGSARVTRYDLPEQAVVLKEWKPANRLLGWWARLVMRRERRHYRLLAGTPGIPRLLGAYGDEALLLEAVEGVPLRRQLSAERLAAGLAGLERALAAIHAKRFVHLDLHQKRNVLVGSGEEVWLIDLGQGLDCSGPLRRWLFPLLAWIDRRALPKFRARYAPETLDGAQRELLVRRHARRGKGWRKRLSRRVRDHLADDPR